MHTEERKTVIERLARPQAPAPQVAMPAGPDNFDLELAKETVRFLWLDLRQRWRNGEATREEEAPAP
jgi:hypothetical protein